MSREAKGYRGRVDRPSGRPALLDKLPRSPVTTPMFQAGAAAAVVFYGLALAAVMSASSARRPSPVPSPTPGPPTDPVTTNSASPVAPKVDPVPPPKPPPPPPVAQEKPKPPPPKPKLETKPPKNQVASVAPMPAPPKPAPAASVGLAEGTWIDPSGDSQLQKDTNRATIALKGKVHLLLPPFSNAPRLMIPAEGDFNMQVKVVGTFKPSSDPAKGAPASMNGAGLLVWQDENNFLRLERIATTNSRNLFSKILVELTLGNPLMPETYMGDAPNGDVTLRVERRKDVLRCLYSLDGQSWQEAKKLKVGFPPKIQVGVSGATTSKKPFDARFEDFAMPNDGQAK